MSAEVLRRAAALMRERAEAATPGPWQIDPTDGADYVFDVATGGFCFVPDHNCRKPVENAKHIASWHPAVALAVADWLEAEATALVAMGEFGRVAAGSKREHSVNIRGAALTLTLDTDDALTLAADTSAPALAVARAYLGSAS